MNTRTFLKIAFAVVLVGALAITAMAADWTVKVDIPFAFQVGATKMPAGLYSVSRFNTNGTLLIRSADDNVLMLTKGFSVGSPRGNAPKLVFNRYGNRYFVKTIVLADGSATELPKSKVEAEYEASSAAARVEVPGQ